MNAEGYLHCGGSIASSNKIITAAHCFFDELEKNKMTKEKIQTFKVIVGTATPFEHHSKYTLISANFIFQSISVKV